MAGFGSFILDYSKRLKKESAIKVLRLMDREKKEAEQKAAEMALKSLGIE